MEQYQQKDRPDLAIFGYISMYNQKMITLETMCEYIHQGGHTDMFLSLLKQSIAADEGGTLQ